MRASGRPGYQRSVSQDEHVVHSSEGTQSQLPPKTLERSAPESLVSTAFFGTSMIVVESKEDGTRQFEGKVKDVCDNIHQFCGTQAEGTSSLDLLPWECLFSYTCVGDSLRSCSLSSDATAIIFSHQYNIPLP